MRRGHPSFGGWRNENHRNFRPRTGGTPRFRPPRPYSLLDGPRYNPPGPRLHHRGPHPYNTHPDEHRLPDHQEINKYRKPNHHQSNQRLSDKNHHQKPRNLYSYFNPNLKKDDNTQYKHPQSYYKEVSPETYHVNSLGDVDQRQPGKIPQPHRINPWVHPPLDQRQFYEERDPYKTKHHNTEQHTAETNKVSIVDYPGHRPPSSDYYGSTSGATINNNDTSFSRSVDDTVDIVRKRLLYRNEPQNMASGDSVSQNNQEQDRRENPQQHTQQEQPSKKKTQRQKQNVKANCDKMKSNIVHQLFKMDKDKMHKLMDDPGSSSKFEYAISSLITESQNSLNRHMRSVAEKSLVSSSSDFIHNGNNTIYEDTFMKQMQCLLDPQDTVLLEDIKPLVMAELSKVLQIDDLDLRYDSEHQNAHTVNYQEPNYPFYEDYNCEEFPQEKLYDEDLRVLPNYEDGTIPITDSYSSSNQSNRNEQNHQADGPIFERRHSMTKETHEIGPNQDKRYNIDSQRQRRSIDMPTGEQFCEDNETFPLFNTNLDQSSEDDDTFAELDKQYHVPVDHNFLDDISARTTPTYIQNMNTSNSTNIKKELDNQLYSLTESLTQSKSKESNVENQMRPANMKQEIIQSPDFPKENSTSTNSSNIVDKIDNIKQEDAPSCNEIKKETSRCDNLNKDKTSQSNSRKRSIDQRPSHRKEKRKKSESNTDTVQSFSHKQNKSKEKYNDGPKSQNILTSTVSSKKLSKDGQTVSITEKSYSDKYVKRKEAQSKKHETHKKRNSSSSNQTILSPEDSNSSSVTPTKCDAKPKFKTIDMFMEQPKKVTVHQAHRNTAPCVTEDSKSKQVVTPLCRVVQSKHVSTQVFKRVINKETQTFESKNFCSKFCQTERIKMFSKGNQTCLMPLDKAKPKAIDAFERMKEIDMEIQELLQEKFKLYNNLESRDSGAIIENLGMTVLNVTPIAPNENSNIVEEETADSNTSQVITIDIDDNMSGDTIINDFTNIPVEELEQIALESVEDKNNGSATKANRRNTRQKNLQKERLNSASPTSTPNRRSKKKEKTPIISLIEQIITDDRPIEDIISLDVLETPPKGKRKSSTKPKKKVAKKLISAKSMNTNPYGLKPCSVVLIRTDFNNLLRSQPTLRITSSEDMHLAVDNMVNLFSSEVLNEPVVLDNESLEHFEVPLEATYVVHNKGLEASDTVEEESVNDLQFDMLDVSEDIVIGDSCEIKDKDSNDHVVSVSEDLILDNSQSSIDDVYCVEAAQAENECKTFDYSTDEELRRDTLTVTGNADAVLAIECIENGFIAACLDGNVYHFSSDGQLLNTMRGSNLAVTCLTIVKEKYGTTVYTGSLDSRIRYYELETGLEKGPECNVLSPIQTMDRAWDTVFVGTRTGFVLQFECKNNMLIPVSTVKFSEQAILALRALKEGPRKVLLVASRSENVTVKDAQTGLLLRTLSGPKMTVYTLLFEDGKVYCGTSSHQIHVFDYASGTHTNSHEGGKGAVCLRATGGLLFAGCYDGCVYVYREGETRPLAQLRGPSLMLLSLAILGSKIIAGYKDRSLYIWKIPLSILQEMIL